ncbi:MAG: hypothetical protein PHI79_07160 [Sulfurovaceae bacterium]|nr:hypothetical protein [Sulfurovaceae bacterium]MDD5549356.1 hypothetical protein [Sulfurovaceae bacterium]
MSNLKIIFLLSIVPLSLSHANNYEIIDNAINTKIDGKIYTSICQNQEKVSILNSQNKNIFTKNIDCAFMKFEDFNKDGYKDFIITLLPHKI